MTPVRVDSEHDRSFLLDLQREYGMGPRTTKLVSSQLAVSGRVVVFSTELACVFHGFVSGPFRQDAAAAAAELWDRDVQRFLDRVRGQHLHHQRAEQAIAAWPAPVIGWAPRPIGANDEWTTVICVDLAWTIAVLSRVDGSLLMPRRPPRLEWDQLFGIPFALDDPRLAAVTAVPRLQISIVPLVGAVA